MAQIKQSRPDSGDGSKGKIFQTFEVTPASLEGSAGKRQSDTTRQVMGLFSKELRRGGPGNEVDDGAP